MIRVSPCSTRGLGRIECSNCPESGHSETPRHREMPGLDCPCAVDLKRNSIQNAARNVALLANCLVPASGENRASFRARNGDALVRRAPAVARVLASVPRRIPPKRKTAGPLVERVDRGEPVCDLSPVDPSRCTGVGRIGPGGAKEAVRHRGSQSARNQLNELRLLSCSAV